MEVKVKKLKHRVEKKANNCFHVIYHDDDWVEPYEETISVVLLDNGVVEIGVDKDVNIVRFFTELPKSATKQGQNESQRPD